jgi:IK cytokine
MCVCVFVRERDPSFVSETYSECYPGYTEYNTELVSDDEEDLTQMDMGRQRGKGPARADFKDEEEWENYNNKREAMPRAAFQYGIKMKDGRVREKTEK